MISQFVKVFKVQIRKISIKKFYGEREIMLNVDWG